MQFAPQQLQGGALYGPRTRVGNWYNDMVIQEEKYAEFRKKKETGKLAIGFRSHRFNICCQKVPHSYSEDGNLRFGDTVMIYNGLLQATLANDPFEEVHPQSAKYMVTASTDVQAMARTTFVITPIPDKVTDPLPKLIPEPTVLHYGQPFQLVANPSIRVDDTTGVLQPPLYLASTLKNERHASKWSNRQMVYMTEKDDYNTVWKVLQPAVGKYDGVKRSFAEHIPVSANSDLVIVHKNTNKPLAVDKKYGESTDFGGEYEVTAHIFVGLGKSELVASEKSGEATGGSLVKPELPENIWQLRTSGDPADAVDDRELPPLITPQVAAKLLKEMLTSRDLSVANIRDKIPSKLDKVDQEDIKWMIKELEVPLKPSYLELLLAPLDKKGNGMISLHEFMSLVQGPEGDHTKED